MHAFFQNKIVRVVSVIVGVIIVLLIVLFVLVNLMVGATGLSGPSVYDSYGPSAPSYGISANKSRQLESADMVEESAPYIPSPTPSGYTSGLETYETSQYDLRASTKKFDETCDALKSLKPDPDIHFKNLNTGLNYCRSTLFADESKVDLVLSTLAAFDDMVVTQTTQSVTRHKQQIENQTSILKQQLTSVSNSLRAAETQFDELANFARQANDAAALSEAIRYKLQNVDTLTQRKISLTAQLDNLYQQAADLEERLDVVEFTVSISRSNPITINKYSNEWEDAWEGLKDTANYILIGITAFFGVFVLWALLISVYLLVVIVAIRGLWKFVKLLWRRW